MEIEMVLEDPPMADAPNSSLQALGGEGGDAVQAMNTAKLAALENFLTLMVRESSYQDFLREMLFTMMRVVNCEAGSILEIDHENQQLFFRVCTGRVSDQIPKFVIPVGAGIAGHVAQSQEHIVVHHVEENQVHLKSISDAVGFEAKTILAFPLVIRGQAYGVVELINRQGEECFTENDVELMKYLCASASKYIEMRLMLAFAMKDGNHRLGMEEEREAA